MTNYGIADENGTDYTVGLQGDVVARRTAQRLADQHGKPVYLYEMGADGEPEEIEPSPLALASKALLAAGWDTRSEDDERIILGVDAEDGDSQLAEIRAIVVPLGCDAEWAGSGNTGGDGLTTEEVIVRAAENDPTPAPPLRVRCACGQWSGERCSWSGPRSETVIVEFMPEHLRSSHAAAGNRGSYPANGSRRIRVERSCAETMTRHDGEWCEEIGE